MWVVQYIQYPFPAGLKVVEYDNYIRAKFDRVPPAPPNHFKGADKITIFEDSAGNGSFQSAKTFVDNLSIATSTLPASDGVWITNAPYLLFFPDKNHDDVPDGAPEVHLSGFGLQDTHAVASSLMWGPDGWIYGANGSTTTGKIKIEIEHQTNTTDFLGQCIWRYHPKLHQFEIFAEGGGNTFGVEFDDKGRIFSGTNHGVYRGLHYVQGGYYLKGWGKHGPLTNPYALGFFGHMPHTGNGDRLTHTYVVYGGGLLPESYTGKIIGPNPLQKRVIVSRIEPLGSTVKTIEENPLLTSSDGWFRPVDLKAGPEGALYVADFYENRISHVDPRDNWERANGRLYRIRPAAYTPQGPTDLTKFTTQQLFDLLKSPNRWMRRTASRLLAERNSPELVASLRELVEKNSGQLALESFWTLNLCGAFNEDVAAKYLKHADPYVRQWAVRLLGDAKKLRPDTAALLLDLAIHENNLEVRSQLASTAKRIDGQFALPILAHMMSRDADRSDAFIPMLLWWAVESKAVSDRDAVVKMFDEPNLWGQPLIQQTILERIAQRYGMGTDNADLIACAKFLARAPDAKCASIMLGGLEKAFTGRQIPALSDELKSAIASAQAKAKSSNVVLGLRVGNPQALKDALAVVTDEKADKTKRQDYVRILGEINQPECVPPLLKTLSQTADAALKRELLTALQRYNDDAIVLAILENHARKETDAVLRGQIQNALASRADWSRKFVEAVDAGSQNPRGVTIEVVRKLKLHQDERINALVEKHWGKIQQITAAEKIKEMDRIASVINSGKGDAAAGKLVFTNTCAKCHKLFNEGGNLAPDLTGYERSNLNYWIENIADPSASIREEFTNFIVRMKDGRVLTGLVAAQDARTVTLALADGQKQTLDREQMNMMKASQESLMPEDQLKALTDQQIRDLFAHLMSK